MTTKRGSQVKTSEGEAEITLGSKRQWIRRRQVRGSWSSIEVLAHSSSSWSESKDHFMRQLFDLHSSLDLKGDGKSFKSFWTQEFIKYIPCFNNASQGRKSSKRWVRKESFDSSTEKARQTKGEQLFFTLFSFFDQEKQEEMLYTLEKHDEFVSLKKDELMLKLRAACNSGQEDVLSHLHPKKVSKPDTWHETEWRAPTSLRAFKTRSNWDEVREKMSWKRSLQYTVVVVHSCRLFTFSFSSLQWRVPFHVFLLKSPMKSFLFMSCLLNYSR